MEDTLWGESSPTWKQARSRPAALRPPPTPSAKKRENTETTVLFPVDPEYLGSVVSVGRVKGR